MNVYFVYTEGDNAPQFYCTEDELIESGDSGHDIGMMSRAEGYARGKGINLKVIEIWDKYDLVKYKELLTKHKMYDVFEGVL